MEDEIIEVNEVSEISEGESETILDESSTSGESIDTSVSYNVDTVSNQLSNSDIAEALRSFIENYSSSSSGSSEPDLEVETDVQSEASASEVSSIDYTSILNDLYDVAENNSTAASSILNYLEVQEENNRIDSSMEDISLSNMLLICIMGVLMFGTCVLYGRRIF